MMLRDAAGLPERFPIVPGYGVGLPTRDEGQTRYQRKREARKQRQHWEQVRRAEKQYAVQLRSVAHHIGSLAKLWDPDRPETSAWVIGAMRRYAQQLWPWATAVSERMQAEVARRDEIAWARHSAAMGRSLATEIRSAPTGDLMLALLGEQVSLISSLPLEAAARVHEWTVRGLETSERPAKVAEMIYASGHVARSRADLIARTEVARTSSKLVESRARHVGSDGYIWRTAGDADVRPIHKKLDGKFFRWDDPPVAGSAGQRAHAGQIFNCRCIPEPVVSDT